jgi:hypothetical protein
VQLVGSTDTAAVNREQAPTATCSSKPTSPTTPIETLDMMTLPKAWQGEPPLASLRAIGDGSVRSNRALALRVPSVVVPEEANFPDQSGTPTQRRVADRQCTATDSRSSPDKLAAVEFAEFYSVSWAETYAVPLSTSKHTPIISPEQALLVVESVHWMCIPSTGWKVNGHSSLVNEAWTAASGLPSA